MSDSLELKIQEVFELAEEKMSYDAMALRLEIEIWDSSEKPYPYYARLTVANAHATRMGPDRKVVAGDQSHSYSVEGAIDVLLAILKDEKPE